MNENTLKIPGAGYQLAFPPCSECLLTIERVSEATPFPGQRSDCYACLNRINVVRTEKQDGSQFDRFSSLARYDEQVRDWKLAGVLFSTRVDRSWMNKWLSERELGGFDLERSIGVEFIEFVKSGPAEGEADVYVKLDEGVYGRVVQDIHAV